jgi:hypothetical protein
MGHDELSNNLTNLIKGKKMNVLKYFLILILFPTLYIHSAYSQDNKDETGSIIGRVIDKNTQQPLFQATISIVGFNKGNSSNDDGSFKIDKLAEDIYKVKIEYLGYAPIILTNIRVIRNKATQLSEIELVESVFEGEMVSVSSGVFREDQEIAVSSTHYNQEEIRRSPGSANDVLRSIATMPGVHNSGGDYAAYSVRGSGPRDNLILVDNIPFEKVVHFDGSANEYEDAQGGGFSIFTPYLINGAEFQGGGFSSMYGGKHSSLLKLRVKEGNKETSTFRGSYDLLGWELNYDGPSYIFKNTRLNISARQQDFKNVLEIADFTDVGHPRLTDLIGKITTDLDDNNTISILGVYGPEKFNRNVDHFMQSDKMEDTNLFDIEETRTLLGLNWRMLTGKSSFFQNTFYYRENDQERSYGKAYPNFINGERPSEENLLTRPKIYYLNQKETELGAKIDYTYQTDTKSTFKTGIEFTQISLDFTQRQNGLDTLYAYDQSDSKENPADHFIVTRPEMVNADFNDKRLSYAAYTEYNFNGLSGDLNVSPGIRYQYNEFSKEHYILPRISGSLRLNEKTRLNIATGLYSQSPRLIDLASSIDNNSLKDEISMHYIAGFTRYLNDDLKFTTEVYYKTFNDLIVQNDRTSELRSNKGEGWAYGVDFSLVKRLVEKLYGQLNYSYSQSKRDDNNGLGEYNHDFDRPHVFNILLGYEFNKKWAFSFKWNYSSGHPKDSYIINKDVHNNPSNIKYSQESISHNTDRSDPIHSLNLRVDYRHQFGQLGVIAFLDIFNLYNNTNANLERFVERTGEVVKVGLGILPTFGFKFEL